MTSLLRLSLRPLRKPLSTLPPNPLLRSFSASSSPTPPSKPRIYAELSKARLSSLVVLTTSCGFLSAGLPLTLSLPTMLGASFGTALCASSASTWNQVLEVDRDKKMKRTRLRPLPAGNVSIQEASALAITTGTLGGLTLYAFTDPLTTALGLGNIALYAPIYTLTKPRSEINTWVGAIVGAIPPVMGWTAAGGNLLDPECAFLASSLFLWQFPHFFALSWMHRVDYSRGGFQMVPCNDPTGDRTASLITRYSVYLSTLPILSTFAGITSSMFAVEGFLLNGYLLYRAKKFDDDRSNGNARKVFLTSLWYLPCLLGLFIFHSKNWNDESQKEIQEKVVALREKGKALCVHEVLDSKDLCPVPHTSSAPKVSAPASN
ncbi:hypothetical protein TrLO_g187 [Triparma laevis f. longispina]|uniref:Heme O synthase n=1 Tax=Triparma laevis f. longispina TaxID=1714387 RepID=A0A9W6ZLI0_9STRA|nr:hypothetical protein TrLO_g187 [Triparma laevis f. longispina]